jgi:hypothetical protein
MQLYALFLRRLVRIDEAVEIESEARRVWAAHARKRMARMAEQPLPASTGEDVAAS